MDFGICLQSVIPVRIEPTHRSEMVTQILFGELYRIMGKEDHWLRVNLAYDNYEGWIDRKLSFPLDDKEFIISKKQGDAFIMYAREGRSNIALGDPIGNKKEWAAVAFFFFKFD